MINCTIQEDSKYNVVLDGQAVGLYTTYGHDQHLFNLITRMAGECFQYEPELSFIPEPKRAAILFNDGVIVSTLRQSVNGHNMREILEKTDPKEFYLMMTAHRPLHLDILEFFQVKDKNVTDNDLMDGFLVSLYLRQGQWQRYQRGVIGKKGKVIQAKFGVKLQDKEEDLKFKHYMNQLAAHFKNNAAIWGI
jgi:hypothetical protein